MGEGINILNFYSFWVKFLQIQVHGFEIGGKFWIFSMPIASQYRSIFRKYFMLLLWGPSVSDPTMKAVTWFYFEFFYIHIFAKSRYQFQILINNWILIEKILQSKTIILHFLILYLIFVLTTSLLSFWLSATQKQGCGARTGNGRNRIHVGTPAPEPEPYSEYSSGSGYTEIKQKTQRYRYKYRYRCRYENEYRYEYRCMYIHICICMCICICTVEACVFWVYVYVHACVGTSIGICTYSRWLDYGAFHRNLCLRKWALLPSHTR